MKHVAVLQLFHLQRSIKYQNLTYGGNRDRMVPATQLPEGYVAHLSKLMKIGTLSNYSFLILNCEVLLKNYQNNDNIEKLW